MDYCLNKNYPLDERWQVWEELSEKTYSSSILRSDDFETPLIKIVAEKFYDSDITRGQLIDYEWFLDHIFNLNLDKHKEVKYLVRDYKIDLILDDIDIKESDVLYNIGREEIIKENFGSYRFDW